MIEFVVPGEPIAWARAGSKGARRFTPSKQKNFMAVLAMYARLAMRGKQPLDGPVELVVVAVYEWPKTWSQKKRLAPGAAWKTSKPDADNIGKLISDSLNCLAYRDDALVARMEIQMIYGERAETRVMLKPLA